MWPRIGPIPAYAILYSLGIVLHFVLSRRIAKRTGLKRRVWIAVSLCYFLGMLFGAKLLYDLGHGPFDLRDLLRAQHYIRGGLWGGLLAYFALAVPAVLMLSRQRRAGLDLVATTIPIPWMAAKLGCLLNGCCYGRPCSLPWAITFPEGARIAPAGIPVHPSQLYEIGIMLIILFVFTRLTSDRWQGTKLPWFLTLYGFGRAATDFLRGDAEHYLVPGVLTLTQLICAMAAVAGLIVLTYWFRTPDGFIRPDKSD
jgi:phosphatidylglycerol---prolipoprotein diacylglyceryl transferase